MPFHPFSREHFVTVAIGAAGGRWRCCWPANAAATAGRWPRRCWRFANLSAYPLNQAAWLSLGKPLPLDNLLPLHLCDIAAITAGFALITKTPGALRAHLFLGTGGHLPGIADSRDQRRVFRPGRSSRFSSSTSPSSPRHSICPSSKAGGRDSRSGKARWKSMAGRSPICIFALTVNHLLGTNFGFASRPPDNPSLIDHLGPWPWYLFSMQALAIILFYLLAIPLSRPHVRCTRQKSDLS